MPSESAQVDAKIKGLGDWRGKTLAQLRALIKRAKDPRKLFNARLDSNSVRAIDFAKARQSMKHPGRGPAQYVEGR